MLESLTVVNLPVNSSIPFVPRGDVFLLKTCQRVIIVGMDKAPLSYVKGPTTQKVDIMARDAGYHFLLETICGLKSKIQGEYEIVSQFKQAYHEFTSNDQINGRVLRVLEKLFKDAKEIRRNHLQEIGLLTYAGIVRKLISQKYKKGKKILILGSGQMAEDIIKITHRKFDFTICARNTSRVKELSTHFALDIKDWKDHQNIHDFDVVINTIGCESFQIADEIIHSWKDNHDETYAICLGEPSAFSESFNLAHNIVKLNEIFAHGQEMSQIYKQKIHFAKQNIQKIVEKRVSPTPVSQKSLDFL
ncbi:hypothetical protein OAT67_05285 [Bacteriovoracaceae bacterium]|nr:hypothetical protein [Bacteriovoracaceae bacterium]